MKKLQMSMTLTILQGKKILCPSTWVRQGVLWKTIFTQQSPLLQEGNSTLYYVTRRPYIILGRSATEYSGHQLISGEQKDCGHVLWSDESMYQLALGQDEHGIPPAKSEKCHPRFRSKYCKNLSVI